MVLNNLHEDDAPIIDLAKLEELCRGNNERLLNYLKQFLDLVPERLRALEQAVKHEERDQVRQIVHGMKPQIMFFGIAELMEPIEYIELEYETIPKTDLQSISQHITNKLQLGLGEVEEIVKQIIT